jgi:hypothetical protein
VAPSNLLGILSLLYPPAPGAVTIVSESFEPSGWISILTLKEGWVFRQCLHPPMQVPVVDLIETLEFFIR